MCRVDLDDVEPGLDGPRGGGAEVGHDPLDPVRIERLRHRVALVSEGRGRPGVPSAFVGGDRAAAVAANGHQVEALRPAWASWTPAAAPRACSAATTAVQASRCASFQRPVSRGRCVPPARRLWPP